MNPYSRTEFLFGKAAMEKLHKSRVAVFGLGGVGGYCAEALARSGIGALELIDHDTISITNINRQILATTKTVGLPKAVVAAQRITEIDPSIQVAVRQTFYGPATAAEFDFSQYDYVVDAIDTVTGKMALITAAKAAGTPIICAMGAGNKLDPSKLQVADIYATTACPLARIMRKECRKRGIDRLKVAYSTEDPVIPPTRISAEDGPRRDIPASAVFVPAAMGLLIASEVVKDLVKG